jgi:hypothetical protein
MREPLLAAIFAALLAVALHPGTARAVPGGDLTVLVKGHYTCELPGNASDPDLFGGQPQPESDFEVIGDSSYLSKDGRGTYLMTGDSVHFTTGKLEGRRFHKVGNTFLREVEPDGSDGLLRCVSSAQGVATAPGDDRRCKRAKRDKVAARKRDDDLAC